MEAEWKQISHSFNPTWEERVEAHSEHALSLDEEVDFLDWCNTNRVDSTTYLPTRGCDIL